MSRKLRIGIIGCGKIAQVRHIPEYHFLNDVEIVALCDTNITRAKEIAALYQIPNVYKEYSDVVNSSDIDAVSICTPNISHADITIKALKNNKHVLVEKPMATTYEDCLRIVYEAEKSKKIIIVGQNQRFHPVNVWVKNFLDSGQLGEIYQFSLCFHHGGPEYWSVDGSESWFFNVKDAGFGVIGDLGIHKVDKIKWLLNSKVDNIVAYSSSSQKSQSVEDSAILLMRMENGALGTITLSWNCPLQDHRSIIYGKNGVITFGETFYGIKVELNNGVILQKEVYPHLRPDGIPWSGVIQHFVDSINGKTVPVVDGRTVLQSMEVIFNLQESK